MSEVATLIAQMRDQLGTGASRELRRNGMVPATIYGAGKEPMSIAVEEKEITKYYKKPKYISQIFELEIDGKKIRVLPKAIDLHPVTEIVRHADFVFIEKDIQKMEVPVVYLNKENCSGVKRGGFFNTVKRSLMITCPVDNLPRSIDIDVKDMPISTSLKAKEIKLPEGVKLLIDPEFVIASIIGKKGRASADEASEGEEESAESK